MDSHAGRWLAALALGGAALVPIVVLSVADAPASTRTVEGAAGRTPPPVQAAGDIEEWKAELQRIAGGVWIASNAEYAGIDGSDEYGMAFTVEPGGLSAAGCLWGEQDGELVAVFWRMFQAWDPTREAGFFYQSHPAGIIGIGTLEDRGPDEPGLIQDFRQPDGTMGRTGHFERWDGPDRRVTRSVDWSGSEWTPRREYTWVRVRDRESRC